MMIMMALLVERRGGSHDGGGRVGSAGGGGGGGGDGIVPHRVLLNNVTVIQPFCYSPAIVQCVCVCVRARVCCLLYTSPSPRDFG